MKEFLEDLRKHLNEKLNGEIIFEEFCLDDIIEEGKEYFVDCWAKVDAWLIVDYLEGEQYGSYDEGYSYKVSSKQIDKMAKTIKDKIGNIEFNGFSVIMDEDIGDEDYDEVEYSYKYYPASWECPADEEEDFDGFARLDLGFTIKKIEA